MQIMHARMRTVLHYVIAAVVLVNLGNARADQTPSPQHHEGGSTHQETCKASSRDSSTEERFDGVQIETSDIGLFEQFFETVLHAAPVQRVDHPGADRLRGYCYRGVLIVVRQDLRAARPTGWVQINFHVTNVAAVQEQIEHTYQMSAVSQLAEVERTKIVRFRFKPDVMRGDRKVSRFEVGGPEGFMIGFDQDK